MSKEIKGALWFGGFMVIALLYALIEADKKAATDFVTILLIGYIFFGVLAFIDSIYKGWKKSPQKKEDA